MSAARIAALADRTTGATSDQLRGRVVAARARQFERFGSRTVYANAQMTSRDPRISCQLDGPGEQLLEQAMQKLGLSALRPRTTAPTSPWSWAWMVALPIADIANVRGDTHTGDELAAHLKKEAELIGLRPEAADLVSMTHPRHRPGGAPPASPGEDPWFWLRLDPAQAERFARRLQRILELPDERIRNILREVESRKAISREKLQWCRHIELLQNLAHAASPETHYARPPCFVGDCKRYHHRSQIEHEDFSAVIETFKRNCCATCSGREAWQERVDPADRQLARSYERRRGVGYRGRQPRRRTTSHEGNDLQDEVAVLSGVQPGGLASDPGELERAAS